MSVLVAHMVIFAGVPLTSLLARTLSRMVGAPRCPPAIRPRQREHGGREDAS
jgi:hypothetical protein